MITVGNDLDMSLIKSNDINNTINNNSYNNDNKSTPLVVIDKSDSSPPTLEHHLAMHLWMGWLALYTLCILPSFGIVALVSLFQYMTGPIPLEVNGVCEMAFQGNNTRHFVYDNYSSPYCSPFNPPPTPSLSPLDITINITITIAQWAVAVCLSVTTLAILISVVAPLHQHGRPNPQWCIDVGHWIMDRGAEYFKLKVVLEDFDAMKHSAETGRPAIFVLEPHDVLPVSIFSLCDYLQALPGKRRLVGCISSACFRVPLMRHVWSWVCAESVGRTNLVRLLSDGVSVCLCPGGVKEVIFMAQQQQKKAMRLEKNKRIERSVGGGVNGGGGGKGGEPISLSGVSVSSPSTSSSLSSVFPSFSSPLDSENNNSSQIIDTKKDLNSKKESNNKGNNSEKEGDSWSIDGETTDQEECVLYLRGRKGFVRLALQHGCPLVPMFSFGQRAVLVPWFCTSSWVCLIGRHLGFVPMVFFGQWNIPFGVPKSRPLTVVVGTPIDVPFGRKENMGEKKSEGEGKSGVSGSVSGMDGSKGDKNNDAHQSLVSPSINQSSTVNGTVKGTVTDVNKKGNEKGTDTQMSSLSGMSHSMQTQALSPSSVATTVSPPGTVPTTPNTPTHTAQATLSDPSHPSHPTLSTLSCNPTPNPSHPANHASKPLPYLLYDPTDEEVESYLETFIIALEKLYAEHAEKYGMGHVRLVVL